MKIYHIKYYEKNKNQIKEYIKEWIKNNPEKRKIQSKKAESTEKRKKYKKEYNKKPKIIEAMKKWHLKHLDYKHKWRSEHKELIAFYNSVRRKIFKLATPKWLTEQQKLEIGNIYLNCPKGYEVDHIIPLRNKDVIGLHVSWNLQYLKIKENRTKRNKFDNTYNNDSWRKSLDFKLIA